MNLWQNYTYSDTKDAVALYPSRGLYLKPVALLHISVQLPQLKAHGKAISNWEIMEKLKYWTQPEQFISLRVSKSTLEFVRFDGEITNKWKLQQVVGRLDGKSIKLSGFSEQLKVRAVEAKSEFSTKHDWDSFFRDSKDMNEMKAGERPDTVYIGNLPRIWFSSDKGTDGVPDEKLLKKIFEQFGEVKRVDIPMLDPYRNRMNSNISGIKQFTFNKNVIFECYVQFKEYFCFVKCMDAFRGMKLLYIDDEKKCLAAPIKVDFDKTKHLSDASIQRRQIIRERLEKKEIERLATEMREKEEKKRTENEERLKKLERRKMREQKRKEKQIEKLKLKEVEDMNKKIAAEEYLLLMAQRKLESIRLLGELINRIKNEKEKELSLVSDKKKKRKLNDEKVVSCCTKVSEEILNIDAEKDLRYKLIQKFKEMQQQKLINEKKRLKPLVSDCSKLFEEDNDVVTPVPLNSASDVIDSYLQDDNDLQERNNFNRQQPRKYWQNSRSRGDRSYFNNVKSSGNNSAEFQARRGWCNRGGRRGFGRQGYSNNWRGSHANRTNQYTNQQYMMPLVDPMLLSYSHEYYKYLQKMARESKRSRRDSSSSKSYSRSRSRSYSRSRSRSRTRSYSRSYSRSWSRSTHRSSTRSRTNSRSKSRSKSRNHHVEKEPTTSGKSKICEINCAVIPEKNNGDNKSGNISDIPRNTKKRKKHKKKEKKKKKRKSRDRKS